MLNYIIQRKGRKNTYVCEGVEFHENRVTAIGARIVGDRERSVVALGVSGPGDETIFTDEIGRIDFVGFKTTVALMSEAASERWNKLVNEKEPHHV